MNLLDEYSVVDNCVVTRFTDAENRRSEQPLCFGSLLEARNQLFQDIITAFSNSLEPDKTKGEITELFKKSEWAHEFQRYVPIDHALTIVKTRNAQKKA